MRLTVVRWLGFVAVFSAVATLSVAQAPPTHIGTPVQAVPPRPTPGPIAAHPEWPAANPEDVKSPEAIIAALSDSISSEAGRERNWERFRSLFIPGAGRLISTRVPKTGQADLNVLSPDEYAARTRSSGQASFYERPIANTIETYGRMTHVYESYELKHSRADEKPFGRGINSWELFFDGSRYYVVQVYWDSERAENPIPEIYLKGSK